MLLIAIDVYCSKFNINDVNYLQKLQLKETERTYLNEVPQKLTDELRELDITLEKVGECIPVIVSFKSNRGKKKGIKKNVSFFSN